MSSHEGKKILHATTDCDTKKQPFCDMSCGEKKSLQCPFGVRGTPLPCRVATALAEEVQPKLLANSGLPWVGL